MIEHRGFVYRVGRRVVQQAEEVGGRRLQTHLQRLVVDRQDAELVGWQLAGDHGLGVDDRVEDLRVLRAGGRVGRAPQAEDEVVRGDRIAVGPAGVGADVEGVDRAVVADVPGLSRARDHRAVWRLDGQALV